MSLLGGGLGKKVGGRVAPRQRSAGAGAVARNVPVRSRAVTRPQYRQATWKANSQAIARRQKATRKRAAATRATIRAEKKGAAGAALLLAFRARAGAPQTGAKALTRIAAPVKNKPITKPISKVEDIGHFTNYGADLSELWKEAKKYYPTLDKMPKTKIDFPPHTSRRTKSGRGAMGGATYTRSNRVFLTPENARQRKSDFARSVPLHEWAHAAQTRTSGRNRRPEYMIEGGAEAFEQEIAKKLGIPNKTSRMYKNFARKVRQEKGRDYILRGQFR